MGYTTPRQFDWRPSKPARGKPRRWPGGLLTADRRGVGARSTCMLLGLTYQLVLFIADLVLIRTRSDAQLCAEVLALRHQLPRLGPQGRQACLAAWRSSPARCRQPAAPARLAFFAAEAGDPAPLAPRPGPAQVGALCVTRSGVSVSFASPERNSIAERFVGTARRELLDHLLIFSARHLEGVIKESRSSSSTYHQARPHQGIEQRCPDPVLPILPLPAGGQIVRHDRLGGLLHGQRRAKPA